MLVKSYHQVRPFLPAITQFQHPLPARHPSPIVLPFGLGALAAFKTYKITTDSALLLYLHRPRPSLARFLAFPAPRFLHSAVELTVRTGSFGERNPLRTRRTCSGYRSTRFSRVDPARGSKLRAVQPNRDVCTVCSNPNPCGQGSDQRGVARRRVASQILTFLAWTLRSSSGFGSITTALPNGAVLGEDTEVKTQPRNSRTQEGLVGISALAHSTKWHLLVVVLFAHVGCFP